MIRRAKIKARPVLRKTQSSAPKPASQPPKPEFETTATPDSIEQIDDKSNSDGIATAHSSAEAQTSRSTANIVEPPRQEDTTTTEAILPSTSAHSDLPKSTQADGDNTKDIDASRENPGHKTIITVRRRKLTACPTISKNRRKPDSSSDASKPTKAPAMTSNECTTSNIEEKNSVPTTTETTVTVSSLSPESLEKSESCVNKLAVPGGRRRKVTACPTVNAKRRKTDTRSEIANPAVPSKTVDVSVEPTVSENSSAAVDAISLPTQEIGASEEVISDVAAVTTIDETHSDRAILDSPVYGIKSNDVTDTTPATAQSLSARVNENDNKKPGVSQQQKIVLPKKAVIKVKTKSLSSNYRSKAMEKLNRLRKNQADAGAWPKWDQNFVSMSDLIFLNPPAESGQRLGMNADREVPVLESVETPAASNREVETQDETGEDAPMPVPQIRIAEDGSVVVDEESLVLDTQKPQNPEITTVYETGRDNMINQRSFVRRAPARGLRWSADETNKFYKCLCVVGAEFSLMSAMFRGRTPDDLRRKFKREHKSNPDRVDLALMQQHLSKWTDDMFASGDDAGIMKPAPETVSQS